MANSFGFAWQMCPGGRLMIFCLKTAIFQRFSKCCFYARNSFQKPVNMHRGIILHDIKSHLSKIFRANFFFVNRVILTLKIYAPPKVTLPPPKNFHPTWFWDHLIIGKHISEICGGVIFCFEIKQKNPFFPLKKLIFLTYWPSYAMKWPQVALGCSSDMYWSFCTSL